MNLIGMQVKDYLELLASDAPAPGGGSASALCGAQGIGMVAMVAKLTGGKEKFAAYHETCAAVAAEGDALCQALARQVDVDTDAYGRIADAFRLPKETEEEKAARKQAIAAANEYAAKVPLDTMELGVKGLRCALRLSTGYNTNCASDLGCAGLGLLSCVKGAWLNVQINLSGDQSQGAAQLRTAGEALLNEAVKLEETLAAQVQTYL